ncbi:hypothetical protein ACVWW6_000042 [Bradyrhizobium sp. USDA 3311]
MMTMPEIERCLRQLRLSGVRDTLQTRVLQAQGANQPFLETFSLILQDELDRRQSRLIERRYQQSGLDEKLTLAEFDWSFVSVTRGSLAPGLDLRGMLWIARSG